jgi:nucleoporin NUP42
MDENVYEDPKVLAQWEGFVSNGGRFADGVMPEVPPRREWCVWDF